MDAAPLSSMRWQSSSARLDDTHLQTIIHRRGGGGAGAANGAQASRRAAAGSAGGRVPVLADQAQGIARALRPRLAHHLTCGGFGAAAYSKLLNLDAERLRTRQDRCQHGGGLIEAPTAARRRHAAMRAQRHAGGAAGAGRRACALTAIEGPLGWARAATTPDIRP